MFSPVIYLKIGHIKEYFSPLLHFAHDFDRRMVLFSRTSFYCVKMTSLLSDMHCPRFQKQKSFFSKTRGIVNMFAFLILSHIATCTNQLFFCFCLSANINIITGLEFFPIEHQLGKKSHLRSWIVEVPQLHYQS